MRAIVPLLGVVLLQWSAANVAIIYFADTIASMYAASIAACGRLFWFDGQDGASWWQRAGYGAQLGLAGLVIVGVVAVPLGVSLFLILVQLHFDWQAVRADHALWVGVGAQFAGALTLVIDDYRRLMSDPGGDVVIKRRFGLVFLRWFAVVAIGYSGLGALGPTIFGALVIATYAIATIFMELAPGRMLRAFDATDLDPDAAAPKDPQPRRRKR